MSHRHPGRHAHKSRTQQRTLGHPTGTSTSICGLVAYPDRDSARRAARSMPWEKGTRARAYQCVGGCGLWHAGYLPDLVVKGVVTVTEWYGLDGRRPLAEVLVPLLHMMRRRCRGQASFERRTGADDTDLWTAILDGDGGMFVAPDYDTPQQAVTAVLEQHRAGTAPTPEKAA